MSMVLSKSPATITRLLPAMRSLGQSGNRLMSRRQASIDCGHGPDTCMARTVGSGETPGTGNRPPIVGIVKPSTGLLVWSGYRPHTPATMPRIRRRATKSTTSATGASSMR